MRPTSLRRSDRLASPGPRFAESPTMTAFGGGGLDCERTDQSTRGLFDNGYGGVEHRREPLGVGRLVVASPGGFSREYHVHAKTFAARIVVLHHARGPPSGSGPKPSVSGEGVEV